MRTNPVVLTGAEIGTILAAATVTAAGRLDELTERFTDVASASREAAADARRYFASARTWP